MNDLETMQAMLKRRGVPYTLSPGFPLLIDLYCLDLTVDGIQIWFTEEGELQYLTTNTDWQQALD